jgi:hypothetical protein
LPWGTNSSGTIFHRVGSSNTNSNPAASSDLLTNGISETRFETVDGVVAYEYPNYRGRSHIFYQAGLHTAPFAMGSIKVPYGYSFFVEPDLENVNCHDLDGVGLADDWKDLSQYCETMRKITILTTPRSGKIEITLLQVNSTIHNEDCKRFYGKVSARALFNGGGLNSFSSWFRRNDMDFINWNRGLVRNILNYSETDVSNVEGISRIITVDEEVMNKTYLHFTTGLGSSHKSCDLCTDFTEDCFMLKPWAAIPNDVGNREFSILISEALDNEIVVLGPYNTTCGHSIWVKFRVRRL